MLKDICTIFVLLVSDDFLSHAPGMEDHRGDSVYCELNRTELVELFRISAATSSSGKATCYEGSIAIERCDVCFT